MKFLKTLWNKRFLNELNSKQRYDRQEKITKGLIYVAGFGMMFVLFSLIFWSH
jgi:hypothetical protein